MGTQLYSPQVRILIPWTERQTDGLRIPFSLAFQAPQGLSASVILGSCRCGHRRQVPGKEKPRPCSHIHTQASMYRDTPTQTCTSTHKHAPMPINTHAHAQTCTVLQAASASWHHWVSIQWGLREGVSHPSHNCRLSLYPSSGLAVRGIGAGCSRAPDVRAGSYDCNSHFYPLPLCQRCSLCPVSTLSSFHKRTPKLRLGTWQPGFPGSCLWPCDCVLASKMRSEVTVPSLAHALTKKGHVLPSLASLLPLGLDAHDGGSWSNHSTQDGKVCMRKAELSCSIRTIAP